MGAPSPLLRIPQCTPHLPQLPPCHNKAPQTGPYKQQMYPLTALEARSLRSRGNSSEGCEGKSVPGLSPRVGGCHTPASLHIAFLLCVSVSGSKSSFCKDFSHWIRVTLNASTSLNHLQGPYFPIRSHPQVLGVKPPTSSWGAPFNP